MSQIEHQLCSACGELKKGCWFPSLSGMAEKTRRRKKEKARGSGELKHQALSGEGPVGMLVCDHGRVVKGKKQGASFKDRERQLSIGSASRTTAFAHTRIRRAAGS